MPLSLSHQAGAGHRAQSPQAERAEVPRETRGRLMVSPLFTVIIFPEFYICTGTGAGESE